MNVNIPFALVKVLVKLAYMSCNVCDMRGEDRAQLFKKKGKGSFYIAQYPVYWTAQSALHFLPSLTDLFIPTPTRLLREAF